MFDLTGKTALVTGATGGIGGAIARALHAQGAKVAVSGTRREVLDALAGELGGACTCCRAISPTRMRSRRWFRRPRRRWASSTSWSPMPASPGTICSCAARTRTGTRCINVNLTATFRLARAAVKGMMRRRFGRIIGITSVVGVTGNPGQANYTAAKAGMIGMIKSIGKEYAKRGVTANCVAPGFIATPMTDKLNDKQREAILPMVPAGRLGAGADVAAAVVYLASDEAAYVTGQTLHVNGGMAMI